LHLLSIESCGDTWDLLAQHGLPPIDDDDAPFGEVIYVCAELQGAP